MFCGITAALQIFALLIWACIQNCMDTFLHPGIYEKSKKSSACSITLLPTPYQIIPFWTVCFSDHIVYHDRLCSHAGSWRQSLMSSIMVLPTWRHAILGEVDPCRSSQMLSSPNCSRFGLILSTCNNMDLLVRVTLLLSESWAYGKTCRAGTLSRHVCATWNCS